MARDPDLILEDVEALLEERIYSKREYELLAEVRKLREDMRIADALLREEDLKWGEKNREYLERQEELDNNERMPRIYLLEADEQARLEILQEADIAIQFTDNIGMWEKTMRTEAKILKHRWGHTGPAEIIENPAR